MKRFSMTPVTRCGQTFDELQEDEHGEWVSFKEHEVETAGLKNKLTTIADWVLDAEGAVKNIKSLSRLP